MKVLYMEVLSEEASPGPSPADNVSPPSSPHQATLGYLRQDVKLSTPWRGHQLWCLLEYPHRGDIWIPLLRQHFHCMSIQNIDSYDIT